MAIITKQAVLGKMMRFRKKIKAGEFAVQLIELNYSNRCNFTCEHCFSKDLSPSNAKLSVEAVKNLADQAHELGAWQWHLQGGEPTIWKELDKIVEAIDPTRFHIFITSNGYQIDRDKAQELARMGIDKVSISIDSFDAQAHDQFRQRKGAFDKAMAALFHVREAGMEANINTCITSQNVRSEGMLDLIHFAQEHSFTILFVTAAPVGEWAGRHDLLISAEDSKYLKDLKDKYSFVHRDIYPLFNFEWGCRTINGLIYITPDGDVLGCPFIHIKIGNILEEPLADILKRGWRVKYFRDYSPTCLVSEHKEFIHKIIPKYANRQGSIDFSEAFGEDDLYSE